MKESKEKLTIKWQRLVSGGETCERCNSTEEEVGKAVEKLKETFPKLGIDVELEKEELTEEEFMESPKASNRIFINGKALERLVNAKVGVSECCDVCGGTECRTIMVNGKEFEVVPSQLIINAAMKVADDLFTGSSCCDSGELDSCCS